MFKLFEWIYKLGVQHERNRIKRLIAEYLNQQPQPEWFTNDGGPKLTQPRSYKHALELYNEVSFELGRLIDPSEVYVQPKPEPALIDRD